MITTEKTHGEVTVIRVTKGDHNTENTSLAEIVQEVIIKTSYPKVNRELGLDDALYSEDEFYDEEDECNVKTRIETRKVFIVIPASATLEDVQDKINSVPDATIAKITSNQPILTNEDERRIAENTAGASMYSFAMKQIVRYGKNHTKSKQIILDSNNKPQYRRLFFCSTRKEDSDQRDSNPDNVFYYPGLLYEIQNYNK